MISHRITKYNPAKRNPDGSYSGQTEWTAISDIGKANYKYPTYEEYEAVEDAYVNAIFLALEENGLTRLTINNLELYNKKKVFEAFSKDGRLRNISVDFNSEIKPLSDGVDLTFPEINKITRLILRETIWMTLESERLNVKFGYDYYMYFFCERLSPMTIRKIEASGLFVEPEVDQSNIVIIDKGGNEILPPS